MKKVVVTLVALLVLAGTGSAQVLTLNSSETLAVPTATKLELKNINIDIGNQIVDVLYRFYTAAGSPIPNANSASYDRHWYCTNRAAQLAADCTGVGEPYPGCTGAGTGEGLDPGTTCFTDTFSFVIRTQDVGTPIGKGLRSLIWSKMRPEVLTGSNNATLP